MTAIDRRSHSQSTPKQRPDSEPPIRYAFGATAMGHVLVAATQRGVCAIALGDDSKALVAELQDRFPAATLIHDEPGVADLYGRVTAWMETPGALVDFPLDIRGTPFQRSVWDALCRIPTGQTVSYSELAERVGQPRAVRAVAGACGANALAVVIPCHRVVRKDGGLSGYRWGVQRKRLLLSREQEVTAQA
ncbi:O-6-methylguanine DNA methyltransferase [Natronocella acetinitrilica]|uniref:O-6-methylguanine DNA methyltransferase n=1 Tax=Natronocella acetinitrilica TaxID=414046 RepID=A0AAE3G0E3_9GAMM|nr:methylated-DNA--[protein]-cysteine S-methyltransferase [Natronocella acetinitrilica]MCP1673007.1 O-6-methylguanine DNA methyltransferase [Natronocella acetinitrilica]